MGDRQWRDNRFFDGEERLKALSASGDPLERLAQVVDFEAFREDLEKALLRSDRQGAGARPMTRC
jgi:IS5 family transposase